MLFFMFHIYRHQLNTTRLSRAFKSVMENYDKKFRPDFGGRSIFSLSAYFTVGNHSLIPLHQMLNLMCI